MNIPDGELLKTQQILKATPCLKNNDTDIVIISTSSLHTMIMGICSILINKSS